MDRILEIILEALDNHALTEYHVYLANVKLKDMTSASNWFRMVAGAGREVFSNPELYDAWIEEIRASMEQDNDSERNPNQ